MKKLFLFCFLFSFFGSFAQTVHRDKFHKAELRGATHSLRSDTIDVLNYDVHLYVPVSSGDISGYTAVTFSPKMNNIQNISFDLLKMTIDSIKIGNTLLTYSYDDTLLIPSFPSVMNSTDTAVIYVYYHGIPQQDPGGWGGWYFSGGYSFNLGVAFTASPHNYGRVWHPCFDNFAEHATYDFYISTNASQLAYCNGLLVSDTLDGSGNRVRYWHMKDAIPSYLASITVSNYTQVNQIYVSQETGDTIPIQLVSQAADTANFKSSFINLPFAIQIFEIDYGPHYWDKIGFTAVPFSAGAMEHVTNITYPKSTITGTTFYETLYAHELSHHWWGDLVTCKNAENMWINEGMAVFSEHIFLERTYGTDTYYSAVRSNHKNTVWKHHVDDGGYFALNAVPQAVTYGSTSYNKGASAAHTMRGYLGDSLFFTGLRTIIANNQLQNIDSDDFMNQLNAINGINVTDFFNDWIFQPGYPQFTLDSFVSVPNGGNYDVTVYVEQRLRGASHMANNVPVTAFFRDENWNVYSEQIIIGDTFSFATVTVPFDPTYATLNEDEKINDATTGMHIVASTAGSKSMAHANFTVNVQSIVDSAFIRVEQNWVTPFQGVADPTVIVSPDRSWTVRGTNWSNMTTNGYFTFNGTETGAGYLDNGLMVDHGAVLFTEDSLLLLYREKASDVWSEFPTYTVNVQSNPTNKSGVIIAQNLVPGEYTFGLRVYGVGINEKQKSDIKLFPNPNDGTFKVDMGTFAKGNYTFSLYDMSGKMIRQEISSDKLVVFSVDNISNGMYYLSISNKKKLIANLPVNIVR